VKTIFEKCDFAYHPDTDALIKYEGSFSVFLTLICDAQSSCHG